MCKFAPIFILASLLSAGCKPAPPATIPVTGVVTLDGQPLAGANVAFYPQGETLAKDGLGQTDAQGRFTVHLYDRQTGQKGPPGLLAGQYKVTVSKLLNPDGTPFVATEDLAPIDSNAKEHVPEAYSHYDLTRLTAEIQPPSKELTFDLRSTPPR